MEMMKALVIEAEDKFTYKDVPVPEIKENEVLIKVKACGICGSDIPRVMDKGVHFYPIIVGHEFAGDVVKVGSNVNNTEVGQRVTAAPLIPCGTCAECQKGNPAMCTHYSFIVSRQDGAMAEYVAVPARNLVPIADSVTYEQGAVIEPITVALHGIERAGVMEGGKTALVYGCGTIGMLTIQCLKAKGIERVYAIDIDEHKLAMAKELGAFCTINSKKVDVVEYFKEHCKVDFAFETAGVNFLQAQIIELVNKRGKIVYIGTAHGDVKLPAKSFEQILRSELFITGSWMSYSAPFPGSEWTAAAEYLAAGKIKADALITHKFPLSEGIKAFETLTDRNSGAIKVMYVMD